MAKFAISVIATIEASSLVEGRDDAERVVELLSREFDSMSYCVELLEDAHGEVPQVEGGVPTYH